MKLLKSKECEKIIVDTTVQEKNVSFPTDAKLLYRAREKLVKAAKERKVELRQSYVRKGKVLFTKHCRYAHARQYKRANRALKKLRTQLGRVIRDIERKHPNPDQELQKLLLLTKTVYRQRKNHKDKIYSLHEPYVECISKGKSHKPYEFGCKVSVASTAKTNWVLGVKAMHGRPFDGETLKTAVRQVEERTGVIVSDALVDKGYRGKKHHPDHVRVHINDKKRLPSYLKKLLKRRSAIEPIIGHMKSDHRMDVNRLRGLDGDQMNPIFAGCGMNIKKILRAMAQNIFSFIRFLEKLIKMQAHLVEI